MLPILPPPPRIAPPSIYPALLTPPRSIRPCTTLLALPFSTCPCTFFLSPPRSPRPYLAPPSHCSAHLNYHPASLPAPTSLTLSQPRSQCPCLTRPTLYLAHSALAQPLLPCPSPLSPRTTTLDTTSLALPPSLTRLAPAYLAPLPSLALLLRSPALLRSPSYPSYDPLHSPRHILRRSPRPFTLFLARPNASISLSPCSPHTPRVACPVPPAHPCLAQPPLYPTSLATYLPHLADHVPAPARSPYLARPAPAPSSSLAPLHTSPLHRLNALVLLEMF